LAWGEAITFETGSLLHEHVVRQDHLVVNIDGDLETAEGNVAEAGGAKHEVATVSAEPELSSIINTCLDVTKHFSG
jgi:hypothetical protein